MSLLKSWGKRQKKFYYFFSLVMMTLKRNWLNYVLPIDVQYQGQDMVVTGMTIVITELVYL